MAGKCSKSQECCNNHEIMEKVCDKPQQSVPLHTVHATYNNVEHDSFIEDGKDYVAYIKTDCINQYNESRRHAAPATDCDMFLGMYAETVMPMDYRWIDPKPPQEVILLVTCKNFR